MKNKAVRVRDYNFKYHLLGRIWTVLGILLFISIPITIGLYYGVKPDWRVFGTSAVIMPFIINFLAGIAEPIIYAPMLGTNSEYLAFITGNLSNLKIPCVVKAHEIYPTENNTEEHEIVATIAVATSTLVTVVIIAVLVLCLAVSNLQSVVEKQTWIMPAFSCVVYALFGSLGGKYIVKKPKLAVISAIAVIVLSVILGVTKVGKTVGSAYLFVGIGICALVAALQIIREKRKQKAAEEQEHLAGIADSHTLECEQPQSDDNADSSDENLKEDLSDIPEETSVCADKTE